MGLIAWVITQFWPWLLGALGLLSLWVMRLVMRGQRSEIDLANRQLQDAKASEAAMDAQLNVARLDADARRRRLHEQSEAERLRRLQETNRRPRI